MENNTAHSRKKRNPWKVGGIIFASLVLIGLVTPSDNNTQPNVSTPQSQSRGAIKVVESEKLPEVADEVTKEETVTESIPYKKLVEDDPSRDVGTSYVKSYGSDGVKETVYRVTYRDGVETDRVKVSSRVAEEPQNHVIVQGSRKTAPKAVNCPDGSYVNSAGNRVCRPHSSSSVPAGATAQCRNGQYSFSQSRRGTCSRNGGVARWL